jgi:hypothetical protein
METTTIAVRRGATRGRAIEAIRPPLRQDTPALDADTLTVQRRHIRSKGRELRRDHIKTRFKTSDPGLKRGK